MERKKKKGKGKEKGTGKENDAKISQISLTRSEL